VLTGIVEAGETMFMLCFKVKRRGLGRKACKRSGNANKRGLSHKQVPVLVAWDSTVATMNCVLKAMDISALAGAACELGVEHHAVTSASTVLGIYRTSRHTTGAWNPESTSSAA